MPLSLPSQWYNAHTFGACTPNESDPMLLLKEVFNIIITTETKPPYSALRIDAWLIVLNLCIKHETHMLGCGEGSPRRQRWMMRWGWGSMGGFLLMRWKKNKDWSCQLCYICISTESGVCFYSDCDFTQLSTDTNKYRRICAVGRGLKSLADNTVWSQCTGYVLYMSVGCLYKLISWSERKTEKESG